MESKKLSQTIRIIINWMFFFPLNSIHSELKIVFFLIRAIPLINPFLRNFLKINQIWKSMVSFLFLERFWLFSWLNGMWMWMVIFSIRNVWSGTGLKSKIWNVEKYIPLHAIKTMVLNTRIYGKWSSYLKQLFENLKKILIFF